MTPAALLNLWANPPKFTPVESVREIVQDMGSSHAYPQIRRAKAAEKARRTVFTPAQEADRLKRIAKGNANKIKKYSFMAGKGWMNGKEVAEIVCLDPESVRMPLLSLVELGVLERVVHCRQNIQYRWIA